MNKVKRLMLRFIGMLFTMAYLWMGSGCVSWTAADGTRHTLILGLGLVSTKEAPDRSATAMRCQTLGLAVRTGAPHGGLVLGYQSLHQTQISPEWQGVIEVNAAPGQPLTVEGHAPEGASVSPATASLPGEGCP